MKIELTKDQCENVVEFIEIYFYQAIRDDDCIDNLDWAESILDARRALNKAIENWRDEQ